jgi:hypothetical protein
MPTYIYLCKYTAEGIKGVQEAPQRRQRAVERIEQLLRFAVYSAVSRQLSAVSSPLTCRALPDRVNIIALVVPRGRASVTLARPRRPWDHKPFSWRF